MGCGAICRTVGHQMNHSELTTVIVVVKTIVDVVPASTTRTFVELFLWPSDQEMTLAYLHKFLEAAGEVDAILRAPLEVRKIVIFKTRSLIKVTFSRRFVTFSQHTAEM